MEPLVEETKQKMLRVLEVLKTDLTTVRTGRATPALVDHLVVSVYGGSTRLKVMELATISASDHQTLLITPYDGSIISEIQKGIMEANTGLTPVVDGHIIRISIPPLSQERRVELTTLMKQKLENGRISLRQVRHEAMNEIKKQFADKAITEDMRDHLEKEVQKHIDEVNEEIDLMGKRKEEELMQI